MNTPRARAESKVQALEKKAVKTKGDIKAVIDARVAQIREEHKQSVKKLRDLAAERLDKRAEQMEKKARQLKNK